MALNIGSWNVRGLGTSVKRAAVFDMLDIFKVGIACLQETHLTNDTKGQIKNKHFFSTNTMRYTPRILEVWQC